MERTVAFRAGNRINTKVGVMKPNHKLRTELAASVVVEEEKCQVISTSLQCVLFDLVFIVFIVSSLPTIANSPIAYCIYNFVIYYLL